MTIVTLIFLGLLLTHTMLLLWLSWRQSRHVAQHRGAVPSAFTAVITLEQHQKAADYTVAKGTLERVEILASALITLGWTLGGGLQWLQQQWSIVANPLWAGAALMVSWLVLSSLLRIPFRLYRTFVIEERFGFNKATPVTFVSDTLKSLVLTLVIATPVVALVLWLMAGLGAWWWVAVWVVLNLFQLVGIWLYPAVIAPWFNTFTPLPAGELSARVEDLLARTGYVARGLFVMDASRRSGHGNAYFTGIGRTKRIVFFDTLLAQLTPAQVEAVLAHEIGHDQHRHISKMIVINALATLAGLAVLAWLLPQAWFYADMGVAEPSLAVALVLFLLVVPVATFMVDPLLSAWSRSMEFEADAYAVAHTNTTDMVGALVSIYRDNAGTLTPDPLYAAYHYSHPPASERIGAMQSLG